jgi:6-phosphogluconolactonase (cycloisomerase 2 family)
MYTITSAGTLALVSGSTFGPNVTSVSFDPSGSYLSAMGPIQNNENADDNVTIYRVDRNTGSLTQVATGLQTGSYPAYVLMLAK